MDISLTVKAEKIICNLLDKVRCVVCSSVLVTPLQATCFHVACAKCFSIKKKCPVCDIPVDEFNLRPNECLSKRTAAVLRIIKSYETCTGKNVLSLSSPGDKSCDSSNHSEDWLFKKDKKFSKKYEKKKREDSCSKLLSVSQNDSPIVFPGETIETSQKSDVRVIDKKPNAIDKVQEWLSVSQVNVGAKVFKGPVKMLYPDIMHEDYFQRNLEKLCNSKNSGKSGVSSPLDSPINNKNVSSPEHSTRQKRSNLSASKSDLNRSSDRSDNISGNVREMRNRKHLGRSTYKKPVNTNDASAKEMSSPLKTNNLNRSSNEESNKPISLCDSDNDSSEANIGVLKPDTDTDLASRPKDKNSWKNVRKMKKVLNKNTKGHAMKLDISVAEKVIPLVEKSKKQIHPESNTPLLIEDIVTQTNKDICDTPEAVRKCASIVSIPSSSYENIASHCKTLDKDYLACEAAKIASVMVELDSGSQLINESIVSEPSLTHLSPVRNNNIDKVGKIIKKIESEIIVSDILKDFEIEGLDNDDSDGYMDGSSIDSNREPRPVHDSVANSFGSIDLEKAEPKVNKSLLSVPFIFKGNLNTTKEISPSSKAKNPTKNIYKISQNGVNIEICSDNNGTSIFIKNNNTADNNQMDNLLKITRDAQTSPIQFLFDNENNHFNNAQTSSSEDLKPKEMSQNIVDYKIHPSLQRFTNFIVPSVHIADNNLHNIVPNVEQHKPIIQKHLDKENEMYQHPCTSNVSQIHSPPLIVSEPLPDSLFDTSFKRKRSPQSISPIKYYTKKPKMQHMSNDISQSINVVFTSQSEKINTEDPSYVPKLDVESLNCDAVMSSVMANIDKDLGIMSGNPITVNIKGNSTCEIASNDMRNLNEKEFITKNTDCSFIPSQRKMIEDETDLRIVSMEMDGELIQDDNDLQTIEEKSQDFIQNTLIENDEGLKSFMEKSKEQSEEGIQENIGYSKTPITHQNIDQEHSQVKDSENSLSTLFDKNTIGFSQGSETKHDAQIFSSLNLPKSIQQLKNENINPQDTSKHAERTVELLPHEELLLTPSIGVGEAMLHQPSNPLNEDSDTSIVEDTPQKSRKFTIIKKSGQESFRSKQSLDKIYENNDVVQINPPKSDTPVTISKFSSDVKICSTPVTVCARRSLSYKDNMSVISEGEEVLQATTSHTATCVEKEFLEQAFDTSMDKSFGRNSTILQSNKEICKTQLPHKSQIPMESKQRRESMEVKNICIGCSCLNKGQIAKVKALCKNMNWKFTNEYVEELTHLIVRVDENNRSQRSIKYVQALAAGKWILSFNWIEKNLATNSTPSEHEFEVLDSSGERGPFVSRTRTTKIFDGFTFYCCPPFSVITLEVLIGILKAAGGHVVESIEDIKVINPAKISILLAEPSNTEDDRFIDMAVNMKVVPINFDWITECLGEGTLCNAGNHLLAPRTLLPQVHWTINLTTDESMEMAAYN